MWDLPDKKTLVSALQLGESTFRAFLKIQEINCATSQVIAIDSFDSIYFEELVANRDDFDQNCHRRLLPQHFSLAAV